MAKKENSFYFLYHFFALHRFYHVFSSLFYSPPSTPSEASENLHLIYFMTYYRHTFHRELGQGGMEPSRNRRKTEKKE
jgi:hypothetical protein